MSRRKPKHLWRPRTLRQRGPYQPFVIPVKESLPLAEEFDPILDTYRGRWSPETEAERDEIWVRESAYIEQNREKLELILVNALHEYLTGARINSHLVQRMVQGCNKLGTAPRLAAIQLDRGFWVTTAEAMVLYLVRRGLTPMLHSIRASKKRREREAKKKE